ncbi:MAG: hypothetical protein ACPGSD_07690 [Flavobacteriales bacterium]
MINEMVAGITTLIGAFSSAGWFFERRKRNALAESVETENEGKIIDNRAKEVDLYKAALDDLGDRYEKRFLEVEKLFKRKIQVLEDEIQLHIRAKTFLEEENKNLKLKLAENERFKTQ